MATTHPTETETSSLLLKDPPNPCFLQTLVALSAISGFLFGFDTGIVSGALVLVKDDFPLSSLQHETVVSATIFTAILGAAGAIPLNKYFGRKISILLASVTFLCGSIVLSTAGSLEWLIVGRLIVGIGIGVGSMVVPMYISEIAPPEQRGTLVTINNVCCPGGQFIAAIISAGLANTPHGWRWMFGLGAVPAGIQLVGFLFMPESPRWLVNAGQHDAALKALCKIRGCADVADVAVEFSELLKDSNQQNTADVDDPQTENMGPHQAPSSRTPGTPGTLGTPKETWYHILSAPHVRYALFIGCGLQFLQQFAGINTVMYYGASIVQMAGYHSPTTAIYVNVGLAAINFLGGFLGIYLVERTGRRTLLLVSLTGVVIALTCLGISFYANDILSVPVVGGPSLPNNDASNCWQSHRCFDCVMKSNCGFCSNTHGDDHGSTNGTCVSLETAATGNRTCGNGTGSWSANTCDDHHYPGWISVVFLMVYLACFAPGMGPMPWTINSEIYPLEARSLCVGIATSVNWISNLMVSLTFLTLIDALTAQGAFWLYAGISGIGLIWLCLVLPETKGLSLKEVVDLFRRKV